MTSDRVVSDTQPNVLQITQCLTELISDVEKAKRFGSLQLEALGLQLQEANLELEKSRDSLAKILLDRDVKSEELHKLRLNYEAVVIDKQNAEEKIIEVSQNLKLKADEHQETLETNKINEQKCLALEQIIEERNLQLVDKQKELDAAVEELNLQLVDKQKEFDAAVEQRDLLASETRRLQQTLDDFRRKDDAQSSELKSLKEKFDNMLLHLHQVQEELDHYYRLSMNQAEILTAGNDLNERMVRLISAINS